MFAITRVLSHGCNNNSDPKWTQSGIVQIGSLSIHCIVVLGTLVIVDHANITKLLPHALLPPYQYISVQHSHFIHFQTKRAAKASPAQI